MQLRIPEILPHVRKQDMHLLRLPAQELRVQPHCEGFEPLFDLDEVPAADVFLLHSSAPFPSRRCRKNEIEGWMHYQMFILRPRPNRDAILPRDQRLEARVVHPPLQLRPGARIAPEIPRGFQESVGPLGDRALGAHAAVFGVVCQLEILEFRVAAGFGEGEGLRHEGWPGDDGSGHVAAVDEVEGLLEGPGLFDVVDFEFHVGRDPVEGGGFSLRGFCLVGCGGLIGG